MDAQQALQKYLEGCKTAEVAMHCGVTGQTVRYWRSGAKRPSVPNALKLEALSEGKIKASDFYDFIV